MYKEEFSREMEFLEICEANKAKIEANKGNIMYFCNDCVNCKYYEEIGQTSFDDDVKHGICHHEGGRSICKGTENAAEAYTLYKRLV